MPQVHIPDSLFEEIRKILPPAVSADEFIVESLRQRLLMENRRQHFYRRSDEVCAAMVEKGISQADIVSDFESFRRELRE